MKLSIIIPCKNEEGNLTKLHEKLTKVLGDLKYELLFIDDGSTDNTIKELHNLYEKDIQHVKAISFSRNFKKEAAMLAGLEHASGEYTCIIDADLQQNPKYILEMYDFLENNKEFDEVAMVMSNRQLESKFMKFCKDCFYKYMSKLSDIELENAASDFRMFRKQVKDAILSLTEKNRFSKGIFSWIGFNIKYLPYEVEPRQQGTTSFGFKESLRYALSGIYAFSYKPLKISTTLGVISLIGSFVYLLIILIRIIWFSLQFNAVHLLTIFVLALFGIQFLLMGIIGNYLACINTEVKNRPVYIVKEKMGFNRETIL